MANHIKISGIYDALRPLHLMLKLSGFAAFTVNPTTLKVKIAAIDVIVIILQISLATVLNVVYWKNDFILSRHCSEIVRNVFPSVIYLNFLIFSCTKVWIFFKRRNLEKLLQLLQKVDDDFSNLGFQFNYQTQKRTVIRLLMTSILFKIVSVTAIYLSQEYYNIQRELKVALFTGYGFFMNLVLVFYYFTLVGTIKHRYRAMNEVLQ